MSSAAAPVTTGKRLRDKQKLYAEAFANNLLRELHFLKDVTAERAQRRMGFKTKAVKKGAAGVSAAVSIVPIIGPAIGNTLSGAVGYFSDKKQEAAEAPLRETMFGFSDDVVMALCLQAGKEMALSFSFVLLEMADKKIESLAHVTGKRALNYMMALGDEVELTTEILLRGIIRGRSGRGVDAQSDNNDLGLSHKMTVEGICGRSAVVQWLFRDKYPHQYKIFVVPKGQLKPDDIQETNIHSNVPDVAAIGQKTDKNGAKYFRFRGPADRAASGETDYLADAKNYINIPFANTELKKIDESIVGADVSVIRTYIEKHSHKPFVEYLQKVCGLSARPVVVIEGDLSCLKEDFKNAKNKNLNFSDVQFFRTTFSGIAFHQVAFRNCEFIGVIAEECKWHACDLTASRWFNSDCGNSHFNHSDMSDSHWWGGHLTAVTLTDVQSVGIEFRGCNREGLIVEGKDLSNLAGKVKRFEAMFKEGLADLQQQIKGHKKRLDSQEERLNKMKGQVHFMESNIDHPNFLVPGISKSIIKKLRPFENGRRAFCADIRKSSDNPYLPILLPDDSEVIIGCMLAQYLQDAQLRHLPIVAEGEQQEKNQLEHSIAPIKKRQYLTWKFDASSEKKLAESFELLVGRLSDDEYSNTVAEIEDFKKSPTNLFLWLRDNYPKVVIYLWFADVKNKDILKPYLTAAAVVSANCIVTASQEAISKQKWDDYNVLSEKDFPTYLQQTCLHLSDGQLLSIKVGDGKDVVAKVERYQELLLQHIDAIHWMVPAEFTVDKIFNETIDKVVNAIARRGFQYPRATLIALEHIGDSRVISSAIIVQKKEIQEKLEELQNYETMMIIALLQHLSGRSQAQQVLLASSAWFDAYRQSNTMMKALFACTDTDKALKILEKFQTSAKKFLDLKASTTAWIEQAWIVDRLCDIVAYHPDLTVVKAALSGVDASAENSLTLMNFIDAEKFVKTKDYSHVFHHLLKRLENICQTKNLDRLLAALPILSKLEEIIFRFKNEGINKFLLLFLKIFRTYRYKLSIELQKGLQEIALFEKRFGEKFIEYLTLLTDRADDDDENAATLLDQAIMIHEQNLLVLFPAKFREWYKTSGKAQILKRLNDWFQKPTESALPSHDNAPEEKISAEFSKKLVKLMHKDKRVIADNTTVYSLLKLMRKNCPASHLLDQAMAYLPQVIANEENIADINYLTDEIAKNSPRYKNNFTFIRLLMVKLRHRIVLYQQSQKTVSTHALLRETVIMLQLIIDQVLEYSQCRCATLEIDLVHEYQELGFLLQDLLLTADVLSARYKKPQLQKALIAVQKMLATYFGINEIAKPCEALTDSRTSNAIFIQKCNLLYKADISNMELLAEKNDEPNKQKFLRLLYTAYAKHLVLRWLGVHLFNDFPYHDKLMSAGILITYEDIRFLSHSEMLKIAAAIVFEETPLIAIELEKATEISTVIKKPLVFAYQKRLAASSVFLHRKRFDVAIFFCQHALNFLNMKENEGDNRYYLSRPKQTIFMALLHLQVLKDSYAPDLNESQVDLEIRNRIHDYLKKIHPVRDVEYFSKHLYKPAIEAALYFSRKNNWLDVITILNKVLWWKNVCGMTYQCCSFEDGELNDLVRHDKDLHRLTRLSHSTDFNTGLGVYLYIKACVEMGYYQIAIQISDQYYQYTTDQLYQSRQYFLMHQAAFIAKNYPVARAFYLCAIARMPDFMRDYAAKILQERGTLMGLIPEKNISLYGILNILKIFFKACSENDFNTVEQILIAKPQIIDMRNIFDNSENLHHAKSALTLATDKRIINLLVRHTTFYLLNNEETLALFGSLLKRRTSLDTYILPFVNRIDELLPSVCYNEIDTVKQLLKKDIPPDDWTNENGDTPLHVAVRKNNLSMVELLLLSKLNPNIQNKIGQTPLHLVNAFNNRKIIEALIFGGAKIHLLDNESESPVTTNFLYEERFKIIFLAYVKKVYSLFPELLSKSTDKIKHWDLRKTDSYPASWREILKTINAKEIFLKLINKNPMHEFTINHLQQLLFASIDTSNYQALEYLLSLGCDPNFTNENGLSLLHYAVQRNAYVIIEMLLKNGADPNIKNDLDRTPLFFLTYGKNHISKALIAYGADITLYARSVPHWSPCSMDKILYNDMNFMEFLENIVLPTLSVFTEKLRQYKAEQMLRQTAVPIPEAATRGPKAKQAKTSAIELTSLTDASSETPQSPEQPTDECFFDEEIKTAPTSAIHLHRTRIRQTLFNTPTAAMPGSAPNRATIEEKSDPLFYQQILTLVSQDPAVKKLYQNFGSKALCEEKDIFSDRVLAMHERHLQHLSSATPYFFGKAEHAEKIALLKCLIQLRYNDLKDLSGKIKTLKRIFQPCGETNEIIQCLKINITKALKQEKLAAQARITC